MQIMIIEDEEILRVSLGDELQEQGYEVCAFEEPLAALEAFPRSAPALVISDIRLPTLNGLDVLSKVKEMQPDTTVILITAFGEVSSAVEAMKKGAFDYVTKPFDLDELVILVKRALELRQLREENEQLRDRMTGSLLIGESESISLLKSSIDLAAQSDLTVLLTGETGTGKDLTASLIHKTSSRAHRPFIKISCAQYSRTVLESELFGHEHGAFTGATRKKKGKFSLADQGTLYLDDVDDIDPEVQVKLLRVMDEKIIEPVGSLGQFPVDIRIIASTKKDLLELVRQGLFRDDLYYRLNAFPIRLPALMYHREDIPLLVRHFWHRLGHTNKALSEDALKTFEQYGWPGNVRELKNVVERLALTCQADLVSGHDVPQEMREVGPKAEKTPKTFDEIIELTERKLIEEALRVSGGNQSQAARSLGMKISTFRDRLAKYALLPFPQ